LIISDDQAYQSYFGNMLKPTSNLKKRLLPEEALEETEDMDVAEVIRKKLFLTNAQFKLTEMTRRIGQMEAEEERIDKTVDVLRELLEKKIKQLKTL